MIRPFAAGWWPDEDRVLVENYVFLWFPNQLPFFMLGIALYFLTRSDAWARVPSISFLKARPIRFLGTVSYSAYLWHFAILDALAGIHPTEPAGRGPFGSFFVVYPCLVVVTAFVSSITYAMVETPMIRRGRMAEVFICNRFVTVFRTHVP
jgi:peptidoglycan/LPS O-acetylase OafA/YrhL